MELAAERCYRRRYSGRCTSSRAPVARTCACAHVCVGVYRAPSACIRNMPSSICFLSLPLPPRLGRNACDDTSRTPSCAAVRRSPATPARPPTRPPPGRRVDGGRARPRALAEVLRRPVNRSPTSSSFPPPPTNAHAHRALYARSARRLETHARVVQHPPHAVSSLRVRFTGARVIKRRPSESESVRARPLVSWSVRRTSPTRGAARRARTTPPCRRRRRRPTRDTRHASEHPTLPHRILARVAAHTHTHTHGRERVRARLLLVPCT